MLFYHFFTTPAVLTSVALQTCIIKELMWYFSCQEQEEKKDVTFLVVKNIRSYQLQLALASGLAPQNSIN